jgi:hypothetical protein
VRLASLAALLKTEGAGKTGCALHPRSRVQIAHRKCAHEHTGSAESIRPSLRNGFTAYNVLSPATGFVATVADGYLRQLDASIGASEPHAFAVRISRARQSQHPRPPHPTARFVTIASRPLSGETGGERPLICLTRQEEYFLRSGLTGFLDLPDGADFASVQARGCVWGGLPYAAKAAPGSPSSCYPRSPVPCSVLRPAAAFELFSGAARAE